MLINLSSITFVKPARIRSVKSGVAFSCQDLIFCNFWLYSKTSWKNVGVWSRLTVLSVIMSLFLCHYQIFLLLGYLFLRTHFVKTFGTIEGLIKVQYWLRWSYHPFTVWNFFFPSFHTYLSYQRLTSCHCHHEENFQWQLLETSQVLFLSKAALGQVKGNILVS